MTNFHVRLKELRISKNLTQQKLADYVKLSKSSINMYERGEREPGLETLEAFADFFNVDLDYLIGITDVPNKALLNTEHIPHTKLEFEIISRCNCLNDLGKQKALEYIDDLKENPKYTNNISDDIIHELKQIATAPMSDTIKQK